MEIKDLPHFNEKEAVWKKAIHSLTFQQRTLVKKKAEFILHFVMATNTSISVREYKEAMFKADKLRKNYDITKLPADKLNRFQRSQLVNIRQEHPDLEIKSIDST